MPYQPYSFPSFGAGLNLRDKADAVSEEECIDAMNVEFTARGSVRQRDGYAVFNDVALDSQPDTIFPHYESDGTSHLIVGHSAGGRLTALGGNRTEVDIESAFIAGGCFGFQRFGAPGNEYTYIGNGIDELWFYDGLTFQNVPDDAGPRTPPKGGALAVSAGSASGSNRLVVSRFTTTTGGPAGGTTSPSHVWFSDPGNPVVWPDNNFIQLYPGDGEAIQAMVNWREFLFVFKESKFFVFYGESQDSGGNPIFLWRAVDTGIGAVGPRAVAVDETGVYFADRTGVYVTTGGEPKKVSDAVDPIWTARPGPFYTGGVLDHDAANKIAVNAFDGELYVNYSTNGTTNDRTLVYDTTDGWWSLSDFPAADMTGFRAGSQAQLFFTDSVRNEVWEISPAFTSDREIDTVSRPAEDPPEAIESYWRSGWHDFGDPRIKRSRERKIWGTGVVEVSINHDFNTATSPTTALTFSGDPDAVITPEHHRQAVRGTVFSVFFFGDTLDQGWSVHRLDHHLAGYRVPSITAT